MRALIFVCVTAVSPCLAQAGGEAAEVTGEYLVGRLGNIDPVTVSWTPDSPFRTQAIAAEYLEMSNREFVRGYIRAVHDATEGTGWCANGSRRPLLHELDADARQALQRLPRAELSKNAATLIVNVWKKTWPCSGKRRSQ